MTNFQTVHHVKLQSINYMLCILNCKGTMDDKFTFARNKEYSTNHEDIDIRISHVISDSENSYHLTVHHTKTPSFIYLFIYLFFIYS